ncbi:MAG: NYN domain-containing protein [Patescibacteria group bacterium]
MKRNETNFAYIDGANLHKSVIDLGWQLDYRRFRIWLSEKYAVKRAYIFIGLVPKYKDLYTFLQEAGFTLVFKETTYDGDGKVKGNCDAELVLKAAIDYFEKKFDGAILVSSDGDYACLVKFFKEKNIFHTVISPDNKCSFLLRKLNVPLVYLDTQRNNLNLKSSHKEKAPGRD